MAHVVVAYAVMAYAVMVYAVVAYVTMAHVVMAHAHVLIHVTRVLIYCIRMPMHLPIRMTIGQVAVTGVGSAEKESTHGGAVEGNGY